MTQKQLKKDWIIEKPLTDRELFILTIMAENAGIRVWDLPFRDSQFDKYPICYINCPGGMKICRWVMGTSRMRSVTYKEVIEAMEMAIKRREV